LIFLKWHGRGREFESLQVHHNVSKTSRLLVPQVVPFGVQLESNSALAPPRSRGRFPTSRRPRAPAREPRLEREGKTATRATPATRLFVLTHLHSGLTLACPWACDAERRILRVMEVFPALNCRTPKRRPYSRVNWTILPEKRRPTSISAPLRRQVREAAPLYGPHQTLSDHDSQRRRWAGERHALAYP